MLVAGRYEGIDERLMHSEIDEEISMGDYVVSGGELPAMMMVDDSANNTGFSLNLSMGTTQICN